MHVASWRATYPGIVPEAYIDSLDVEEFAARWRERIVSDASILIRVAERKGMLCGFVAGGALRKPVGEFGGEVYALYLLPEVQGQGIGRALFAHLAEELARQYRTGFVVSVLAEIARPGFTSAWADGSLGKSGSRLAARACAPSHMGGMGKPGVLFATGDPGISVAPRVSSISATPGSTRPRQAGRQPTHSNPVDLNA